MKFRHQKELQFEVKVDRPDPMLARQVQEVLGGQFGEMTVMMQYLSQGFNCRGEEKYKDMLMDIRRGTHYVLNPHSLVIIHVVRFIRLLSRRGHLLTIM